MLRKLRDFIDTLIQLLRIPVGLVMLLSIGPLLKTYRHYWHIHTYLNYNRLGLFAIGIITIFFFRYMTHSHRSSVSTLEHELTHVLFALLTFHKITSLKLNDEGGGQMSFKGKGNWLIALSPYFFPLCVFGMILVYIYYSRFNGVLPDWVLVGIGVAFGYNLCSFKEQLHPGQTDFQVAGFLFTICFIPSANLITFGSVFAFVERDVEGLKFFFNTFKYFLLSFF